MSKENYTILVTAATGIVAGQLLAHLQRLTATTHTHVRGKKVQVIASARSRAKADKLVKDGKCGKAVVLDFDRPRELPEAFRGVDAMFIATGYTGDMVHQTKWIVDAAKSAGVTHIVHLGADTTGALGFYIHISWHAVVEKYLETEFSGQGRSFTNLNPGYFTSNLHTYAGQPFFDPATNTIKSLFPPFGVSPWIATDDIAEVGARCLLDPDQHGGKVYSLATEPMAIDQVCEIISKVVGRKITYKLVEPETVLEDAKKDAPDDYGRLMYMKCISEMIRGVQRSMSRGPATLPDGTPARGRPPKVWPEVIQQICGRKHITIEEFAKREADKFGGVSKKSTL